MNIKALIGQTITEVRGNENSDMLHFVTASGDTYVMCHHQDCCESVSIHEIYGDLQSLVGTVIEDASESESYLHDACESGTETRYMLRGAGTGLIMITWHGFSNGYYGEGVDFYKDGGNRWDD